MITIRIGAARNEVAIAHTDGTVETIDRTGLSKTDSGILNKRVLRLWQQKGRIMKNTKGH